MSGFIAILACALWYCNSADIELYAVYSNVSGLQKNDPVMIENVPVGKVKNIQFDEKSIAHLIVTLNIKSGFNIPDKSIAEIVTIDQTINIKGINISLVASNQYLKQGDTILTGTNFSLIDSLIQISKSASQLIKDSLQNKQSDFNFSPDEPVYKVQIFVSKSMLTENDPAFKGLQNVNFYFENSYYKYVAGNFRSISEAKRFCENIKNKGCPDAFVVAFSEGKRISIEEAGQLLKN
ncbi:MAG: MlaD family protein [Bacteroidales bacterium]